MKTVPVVVFALLALFGCAQTTNWIKVGGSHDEFNRTQATCHNDAYLLPRTEAPLSEPSYRITVQPTVYGNANVTATPFRNPYQSMGDGLAGLAATLDNIARREAFMNNCMVANGWRQISESEMSITVDTYARIGVNPVEEYSGKATGYMNGTGTIDMINEKKNQCVGTFRYDPSFKSGKGVVRCDDGDSAQITFTPITNTSGYGAGTTVTGRPLRFVYGVPPESRDKYLHGNQQ
jgi:hypothetical protein